MSWGPADEAEASAAGGGGSPALGVEGRSEKGKGDDDDGPGRRIDQRRAATGSAPLVAAGTAAGDTWRRESDDAVGLALDVWAGHYGTGGEKLGGGRLSASSGVRGLVMGYELMAIGKGVGVATGEKRSCSGGGEDKGPDPQCRGAAGKDAILAGERQKS